MCAGGFHCTRVSLTFLNIVYLAISFIIIGIAGYSRNVGIIDSTPLVGGVLTLGVFLILVSILGIIATLRHHQVMLFFYILILFLLFVIQFAVSISCLALSHLQQINVLKKTWQFAPDSVQIDAMTNFDCCGYDHMDYEIYWKENCVRNTTDKRQKMEKCGWCAKNSDKITKIPNEIKKTNKLLKDQTYYYCEEKIERSIDKAVERSGGVSLFFSFTEMFGVWLAIRYRNQRNPAGPDPRAFGE